MLPLAAGNLAAKEKYHKYAKEKPLKQSFGFAQVNPQTRCAQTVRTS